MKWLKWFLPAAFLAGLYLCFFLPYMSLPNINWVLVIIALLVLVVISTVNIIYAFRNALRPADKIKNRRSRRSMKIIMITMKLLTIPFFVINFVFWTCIMAIPFASLIVMLFLPVILLLTFMVLLVTSAYSVSMIILYSRAKMFTTTATVINIILQFIYVVDVFDAIYLVFKTWKLEKAEKRVQSAESQQFASA